MGRNSKLLTAKAAKNIDLRAKELLGISVLALMENAGRAIAEEALKTRSSRGRIALFCGKGNNGGDGFVAARHLLSKGVKPDIFLAGSIPEVKDEARINLEILLRLKQKITEIKREGLFLIKRKPFRYSLIIDALLGVGLTGKVRGVCAELIPMLNTLGAYILSVDIPSGLDATTGKIFGCCVKAHKTITFVARKRGMVFGEGPKYCGKVVVKDLGIPL